MKNQFLRSELSLNLRMRMIRCYIFSILLYSCESWTLDRSSEKRIDAFEMYLYRRMLRLSWIQKITNAEVLRVCISERNWWTQWCKEKHYTAGTSWEDKGTQYCDCCWRGKVEGKRSVGRRQNSCLKDLRRWLGRTSLEIFRAAVSRTTLAKGEGELRRRKLGIFSSKEGLTRK